MENLMNSLKIMGIGLGGVFLILILFFFITKLMIAVAKKIPSSEE
jgi:Na+-transporting methylmalonyl-CoA/oxaloacetate decarboxylase gamma subunit